MRTFKTLITLSGSVLMASCLLFMTQVNAQENDNLSADKLEALKSSALKLNRDLLILEEELLYPASNQLGLFVSMDVGHFFELRSIKVMMDEKLIASHLYTDRQLQALFKGGIQRLHMDTLKSGSHTLRAVFTGVGPNGRDYKRAADISFDKGAEPVLFELIVNDSTARHQPEFVIKRWQTD